MPNKNDIEKEYENFKVNIRKMAEDEIKRIEEKIGKVREEAEKIGQEIESSSKERKS